MPLSRTPKNIMDNIEATPVRPRPEGGFGFHQRHNDADQGDDLRQLGMSARANLKDAQKEWSLFTMGAVFARLPLPVDPIQEFINSCDEEVTVAHVRFGLPLFHGLEVGYLRNDEALVWNHTLFACRNAGWPLLRRHLSSIAVVDRDRSRFFRTFWHTLSIVDTVELQRHEQLPDPVPMVEIEAIGFSDGQYDYGLLPGRKPLELPRLGAGKASVRDKLMGVCVLADIPMQTATPSVTPVPPRWNPQTGKFDA